MNSQTAAIRKRTIDHLLDDAALRLGEYLARCQEEGRTPKPYDIGLFLRTEVKSNLRAAGFTITRIPAHRREREMEVGRASCKLYRDMMEDN